MSKTAIPFFSHNHNLLKVTDNTSPLDVLSFEGTEALSAPFSWKIIFTSSDKNISREAMLLKTASLTLQPSPQSLTGLLHKAEPLRVVQGVVTGFDMLGVSADEARYAIRLQPRLALLARTRQNAIWQDASVPQIVESILRDRHGMRGQDFVFNLSRNYPKREQVMQFDEDDLRFVSRLLAEVGIWFRFTTDTRLNIDVVEFYDGPQGYQTSLTLAAVPPSGLHDNGVESVWDMESRYRVVEKTVSTRDYNYRDATADMNAQADVTGGDDTTYGEAYHWADNYLQVGEVYSATPTTESGAFYARLRHERYLNRQTQLSAKSSCATLMPGVVVRVSGSNAADVFHRGVVITSLLCRAARDSSMETLFHGIPAEGRYSYRPEPAPRPVMAGTLPARITSTTSNDTYGHIDRAGRYRVSMLFDRAGWESGFESLWVRQSRPFAGDTYGLHLPLLAGTEVAIGFEHGNPDRPYIAGVLHDSSRPDHVTIRNYKRNVLRTPSNNKLRLDDTRGQEHIKLSTEYGGKSQLNLGHLVDDERQARGEGAELRSDEWVAIRGGKGVLLTTQLQPKAMAKQLDMDEIKRQLTDALSLAQSLSGLLETAQIDPMDNSTQQQFLQQTVDQLQQPAIVAGAPAGIALSTPQHIQLSANHNQIITAGGNTEISALKRMVLAARKGFVAFAHEMGMKLVAATGKVEIQAQTNALDLIASKALTISSTSDEIIISAKRKITLQCGGSSLTIDPSKIELGTGGQFNVKSAEFDYAAAAKMAMPFPEFTACESAAADAASNGDATVPLN